MTLPPNKPLVPTRKGEAPLLAAQRRSSAWKTMIRVILCVLAMTVGTVGVASACSCIRESNDKRTAVAERLERAQLVFLGRIEVTERFTLKEEDDFEVEYQRVQFYILESWKGENANRVFVQSAITCCLCGYEFPKSGVFLVFAYGPDKDGYYKATSCTRPVERSEANEDIAILNELVDESRTSRSTRSRAKTRAPG